MNSGLQVYYTGLIARQGVTLAVTDRAEAYPLDAAIRSLGGQTLRPKRGESENPYAAAEKYIRFLRSRKHDRPRQLLTGLYIHTGQTAFFCRFVCTSGELGFPSDLVEIGRFFERLGATFEGANLLFNLRLPLQAAGTPVTPQERMKVLQAYLLPVNDHSLNHPESIPAWARGVLLGKKDKQ